MPPEDSAAKPPRRQTVKERRAARGQRSALQWLKGLLIRPLALQRRNGQLHVVLVDRRVAPAHLTAAAAALREELRERLLGHAGDAAHALRHIVRVHDALGRDGWAGVEALSSRTLGKARVQAQMLHGEHASDLLADLAEKLRVMKVAAELREERAARPAPVPAAAAAAAAAALAPADSQVEVSEATTEEFDATERSWVGTLPGPLPPAEPGSA